MSSDEGDLEVRKAYTLKKARGCLVTKIMELQVLTARIVSEDNELPGKTLRCKALIATICAEHLTFFGDVFQSCYGNAR